MTRYAIDALAALRIVRESVTIPSVHQLVAPSLLRSQALSIIYRATRAGDLDAKEATRILDGITTMKIRLLGDRVSRAPPSGSRTTSASTTPLTRSTWPSRSSRPTRSWLSTRASGTSRRASCRSPSSAHSLIGRLALVAEVVIVGTPEEGGALAADAIERLVRANPEAVLGLATGSTPLTIWRSLADRGLDFSRVRGFALDEYVGLPPGHPSPIVRSSRARSSSRSA